MFVRPDPALIDCRAIICMALQASIRQLKDVVNEIFLCQERVFALARQLHVGPCARVCDQTKESTLRGKQQNYKHGCCCYYFFFLHHLMAGAVWWAPNITSSSFTLIYPSRLLFPNGFLFLLLHLLLYSFYLVLHTINAP